MKDGRPSRINDIRLFAGDKHSYLKGHEEAIAFGRRMALYLNGEGFSLGANPALYIALTTDLQPGVVNVTDEGGEWWQRYTYVGVPEGFPDFANASEIAIQATVEALKACRPDLTGLTEDVAQVVRTEAEKLRLLIRSRRTKKFVIDTSLAIDVWPRPSLLFISLTEISSGAYLEAPPMPLVFYSEAFNLAGQVGVDASTVKLLPRESVAAKLSSELHGAPYVRTLADFKPADRPAFSKLIKMRG